jgi:hypothetical protein
VSGTWQVRGRPTPAELAAVVAVLSAVAASGGSGSTGAPGGAAGTVGSAGWSAYWRSHRTPVGPGPGAWRASGWPR